MSLHNKVDKKVLKQRLADEPFRRITLSFYRYVHLEDPAAMRDRLYAGWEALQVFGRIYVAREGINAQLSVPEHQWEAFAQDLQSLEPFRDMPLKIAREDDGKSFYKLIVKVRKKLVADGLEDGTFDVTNVGQHLTAREFNDLMGEPDAVVVDMRNHYESEIGHFEGAICPDVDTFREELPAVLQLLQEQRESKVMLYCTGGIRCEKASAYLKHHGFGQVYQLHGGIIDYARQVEEEGLDNRFVGKNFVFDERLGERISGEVISKCHQCGAPADTHTNCANQACHQLFIQCAACAEKQAGCCSDACTEIIRLPEDTQRELRKHQPRKTGPKVYRKGRLSTD
ncbi:MAG: rhodanese-related sulfurtransferase [Bacteroidota bacterium]